MGGGGRDEGVCVEGRDARVGGGCVGGEEGREGGGVEKGGKLQEQETCNELPVPPCKTSRERLTQ